MKLSNAVQVVSHYIRANWRWHHLHGAALERYQDQRVQRLLAYVEQHSPFYRQHWAGYDLRDWHHLPSVDKQTMMEHFATFNTRGISKEAAMAVALQAERNRDFSPAIAGLTVGLSSGTSGHRGLFLVSPEEQAAWAGVMVARVLHRLPRSRVRVAFFLRSNSNLYEEIGGGPIQFRYFDLMTPLNDAVQSLNSFQPHIVLGPPSLLGLLADEQTQARLSIHPQRLISIAEVLEEQDQQRLQAVFACPVHQIYQCTEGLLAVSCAAGLLHIQEDLVALQFEPVANEPGERVTPIVTDLWRTTQPIVRYRLNDILRLAPAPCSCGSSFRVIAAIEGRSDDLCYFVAQTGGKRHFFPDTIRRMILLADPRITDYQAVQQYCGQLRIHLAVSPDANFADIVCNVRKSVDETIAQYDCCPAAVQIEEGLLLLPVGTKRRRVQRLEQD
jgi:putative adenylate-forming enzyme